MAYTGSSIVDYLSSSGKDSSFGSRSNLASQYGIKNYTGTAEQNTQLLNSLRGGNNMGVNAVTPVTTPQSSYTLPKNQTANQSLVPSSFVGINSSYGNNNSTAINTIKNSAPNPTLVQLSKDMVTRNTTPNMTVTEDLARNWGLAGQIPVVAKNIGQNILQAGADFFGGSLGKGPGYVSPWQDLYGPTAGQQAQTDANNRIADTMLQARGVKTPNASDTASSGGSQSTSTGNTSGGSTGTPLTREQQIAKMKDELASLQQQYTTQKAAEEAAARSNQNQRVTQTVQQPTAGQNSYWKNLLDTTKNVATSTQTPPIVQKSMDRISNLQDKLAELKMDYEKRMAGLNVQGMSMAMKQGEGKAIQDNYMGMREALTNELNQANTQLQQEVSMYGTQAGLLQNLVGQTAPQMQFGQITDPLTGMPMSGGQYGSNPQLQTAVQQAYQIYQANGGNIYDPRITAITSTFGMPADVLLNQFAQAGNGGQMPNFAAQSSSVGTRNALIEQLGPQAVQLDSALQSIGRLTPIMEDFMAKSGIAPTDNRTINQLSQDYRGAWGDQATTQFQTMLGELQKFSSAVLGSGTSLTPSAQTHLAELQNPGTLSLPRIKMYLEEIKNLGQSNLNVQLQQIQNMGGTGYFGNSGPQVTTSTYQPNTGVGSTAIGGNVQDPYAQAGMGILPWLAQTVGGVWLGAKALFK